VITHLAPKLEAKYVDILYKKMYTNFVEALDAIDNGTSRPPPCFAASICSSPYLLQV